MKQPYVTSESSLMGTVADGWLPRAVAEKVSQVQYKSLSRKKQVALLPLTPRKSGDLSGSRINQKVEFWKVLYKEEGLRRHDLTALHLLDFGSYVPLFDVVGDTPDVISVSAKPPEKTYNKCGITSIWWQQIGPGGPMRLNSMLAPSTHHRKT